MIQALWALPGIFISHPVSFSSFVSDQRQPSRFLLLVHSIMFSMRLSIGLLCSGAVGSAQILRNVAALQMGDNGHNMH